jgi:hypothetical protein
MNFFRTAAGPYNYVLIVSLVAWIISTLGVLAGLLKHRTDTVAANESRRKAEEARRYEEIRRQTAEDRLATAEAEIQKLRPKPLKDRVLVFLSRLDDRALRAATNGQREFRGTFTTAQLTELQSLCAEDKNGDFIKQIETGSIIIPGAGRTGGIMFVITDTLYEMTMEGSIKCAPEDAGGRQQFFDNVHGSFCHC